MFCIRTYDYNDRLHSFSFVNPEIIEKSDDLIYLPDGEGCLSVPRATEGIVPRHSMIKIKTKLFDSEKKTLRSVTMQLSGYMAIIFQHEFDHLDGILFVDKLTETIPENANSLFEE